MKRSLCFSHARRRLFEMSVALNSPIAAEAVDRIDALYDIEREIRGLDPEARLRERRERAVPLLENLYKWLTAHWFDYQAALLSPGRSATPSSLRTGRH